MFKQKVYENVWHFPKQLCKSRELDGEQKFIISVTLQYLNAGVPEKANSSTLPETLGLSEDAFATAMKGLEEKGLASLKEGQVILNHLELIRGGLLSVKNYANFDDVVQSK